MRSCFAKSPQEGEGLLRLGRLQKMSVLPILGKIVSQGLEKQGREEWDQAVASQQRKLNSGRFPTGVRERQ